LRLMTIEQRTKCQLEPLLNALALMDASGR
jgi:hypothetical protein